jgi:hypothetical protein
VAINKPGCQGINHGLIEPRHRSQGTGDQVQFILDHQVGRGKLLTGQWHASVRITRTVKSIGIVSIYFSKERACLTGPRQSRELIHCGDQEARQAAVDGFIHSNNRQVLIAMKSALVVRAMHPQVGWSIRVGH